MDTKQICWLDWKAKLPTIAPSLPFTLKCNAQQVDFSRYLKRDCVYVFLPPCCWRFWTIFTLQYYGGPNLTHSIHIHTQYSEFINSKRENWFSSFSFTILYNKHFRAITKHIFSLFSVFSGFFFSPEIEFKFCFNITMADSNYCQWSWMKKDLVSFIFCWTKHINVYKWPQWTCLTQSQYNSEF